MAERTTLPQLQAEAVHAATVSGGGLVQASSAMWMVLDEFITAMASGYQEEMGRQLVGRQQERSAMVQALIDGRLPDTAELWNTADTLRISLQGPYVVVCPELANVGRSVLPDIENRLSLRGIFSAWWLQPDIEIGISPPIGDLATGARPNAPLRHSMCIPTLCG